VSFLTGWDEATLANYIMPQFTNRPKPARMIRDDRRKGLQLLPTSPDPRG